MCPPVFQHLLVAVVRDVFALTLQTFELQVDYGFCWDEGLLSFLKSICQNVLKSLAFFEHNCFGVWWWLSYDLSEFRSVFFLFTANLFRDRCPWRNLKLLIAIINVPLAHRSSKLVSGCVVTEFLHSLPIVLIALSHQIPENALLGFVPLPPWYLVLGKHLRIPGPESVLTELKVVVWVCVAVDLNFFGFEPHECWLFAVEVSVAFAISFFRMKQITLF